MVTRKMGRPLTRKKHIEISTKVVNMLAVTSNEISTRKVSGLRNLLYIQLPSCVHYLCLLLRYNIKYVDPRPIL